MQMFYLSYLVCIFLNTEHTLFEICVNDCRFKFHVYITIIAIGINIRPIFFALFLIRNEKKINKMPKIVHIIRYLSIFRNIRKHNDKFNILLPDHPPKIVDRQWFWSLRRYICFRTIVTLFR